MFLANLEDRPLDTVEVRENSTMAIPLRVIFPKFVDVNCGMWVAAQLSSKRLGSISIGSASARSASIVSLRAVLPSICLSRSHPAR
jgi:hypothetical protein